MTRSEERNIIMTILYQINVYDNNKIKYDVNNIIDEVSENKSKFIVNAVNEILNNKKEIDNCINKYLKDWTINRLGNTDQSILRLGMYELMYTKTAPAIIINEAVELAKKYSDDSVKKMINACLDAYLHEVKNE